MARSKAHENLHKLSPILYKTLVHLDLMPHRELTTPDELQAVLQGVDSLRIDATERAYHRSQDDAKQRAHYRGKKNSIRGKTRSCLSQTSVSFFLGGPFVGIIMTTSC
jgi:ribosome modulation factor